MLEVAADVGGEYEVRALAVEGAHADGAHCEVVGAEMDAEKENERGPSCSGAGDV